MSDEKVKVVFDLDTKEAIKRLAELADKVDDTGKPDRLAGLLDGLQKVAGLAGVLGTAYLALKTTLDTVFEAEQIKAINQQFEVLTKNAGLAGDALKDALMTAADGLIDDTDLMREANQAILTMGSSAQRLPEILELSRKATALFGGEFQDNFGKMNQAIATGQTRMLKQLGIVIDNKKAFEDYARSIGVAANELSEAGQRQAILNAVLEKGKSAFKDVDTNILQSKNTFDQLIVTIGQVREALVLAFERTMGPTVQRFLNGVKEMAGDFKRVILDNFGEGADQAHAKVERLELKIRDIKGELIDIEQRRLKGLDFEPGMSEAKIQVLNMRLKEYQAELEASKAKVQELDAQAKGAGAPTPGGAPAAGGESSVDYEQKKLNEAKFQQEMTSLKQQALQAEMQMVDDLAALEDLKRQERLMLEQQFQAQKAMIQSATHLTAEQKAQQIVALEEAKTAKLKTLEQNLLQERIKALDNYKKASQDTADGILRGFQATAEQERLMLEDFQRTGERAYGSFKMHATNAFVQVGAGAMTMGEAVKSIILNVLGDEAIARGSVMMMSGIWPPNPVALGGGAALITFGGYLKAQAGKSGGGSSISAASSGGGGGASSTFEDTSSKAESKQDKLIEKLDRGDKFDQMRGGDVKEFEAPRKTVTFQVMGNFFETEETRTRLMEMMRESTDATDFKYQQIGE